MYCLLLCLIGKFQLGYIATYWQLDSSSKLSGKSLFYKNTCVHPEMQYPLQALLWPPTLHTRNFTTSMCINSNFCINWLRFHMEDHLQWWQLGLWLKSSSLQQFSIEESIVSKPEGSVSNVETRKVLIGCTLWIAGHRERLSTRSHVASWGVWGRTFSRNNYNCFPSCHCVPAQSTLKMQEFFFFFYGHQHIQ